MNDMDPTPPLEYRAPRDEVKTGAQPIGPRYVGAVIASVAVFVTGFLTILGSMDIGGGGGPRNDPLQVFLIASAPIALLAAITTYQHFIRRRRWFFQGVLIGIGIAALIEGACFALFFR
jgi:hypothetical protein